MHLQKPQTFTISSYANAQTDLLLQSLVKLAITLFLRIEIAGESSFSEYNALISQSDIPDNTASPAVLFKLEKKWHLNMIRRRWGWYSHHHFSLQGKKPESTCWSDRWGVITLGHINTTGQSNKANCIRNNEIIWPHLHLHTRMDSVSLMWRYLSISQFLSAPPPSVLMEQPACEVRCQALLLLVDHDFAGRALNNSAGPHAPWERN